MQVYTQDRLKELNKRSVDMLQLSKKFKSQLGNMTSGGIFARSCQADNLSRHYQGIWRRLDAPLVLDLNNEEWRAAFVSTNEVGIRSMVLESTRDAYCR